MHDGLSWEIADHATTEKSTKELARNRKEKRALNLIQRISISGRMFTGDMKAPSPLQVTSSRRQ